VIEVTMNYSGFPILLYDTAGIRETMDIIEQEGVRRTQET
jgi:tRNA modification GTPase